MTAPPHHDGRYNADGPEIFIDNALLFLLHASIAHHKDRCNTANVVRRPTLLRSNSSITTCGTISSSWFPCFSTRGEEHERLPIPALGQSSHTQAGVDEQPQHNEDPTDRVWGSAPAPSRENPPSPPIDRPRCPARRHRLRVRQARPRPVDDRHSPPGLWLVIDGRLHVGCGHYLRRSRQRIRHRAKSACGSRASASIRRLAAARASRHTMAITHSSTIAHPASATARVGPPWAPCSLSGKPTNVNRVFTILSRLARFS